jgi:lipocalin
MPSVNTRARNMRPDTKRIRINRHPGGRISACRLKTKASRLPPTLRQSLDVFELDHEQYQHALVSGPSISYRWILARTPTLDDGIRNELVKKAAERGFDTSALIFVEHE